MEIPLIKHPSAFLPLAMSLAALAIVLGHVATYGVIHEADEGTAAHLFQILMAGQVPIVLFFAVKWLPKAPKQTMQMVALMVVAASVAFASVYLLT